MGFLIGECVLANHLRFRIRLWCNKGTCQCIELESNKVKMFEQQNVNCSPKTIITIHDLTRRRTQVGTENWNKVCDRATSCPDTNTGARHRWKVSRNYTYNLISPIKYSALKWSSTLNSHHMPLSLILLVIGDNNMIRKWLLIINESMDELVTLNLSFINATSTTPQNKPNHITAAEPLPLLLYADSLICKAWFFHSLNFLSNQDS